MERKDIQIISRNSNLTKQQVEEALKENVYNSKDAWQKFFQIFFMSLGIGFTVSGIIFFFAYNWADLNKFVKLGLIQGLLIASIVLVLTLKVREDIRNIILTGASILVGVLFAVFGQIYQTGANAYDFFLAWTIFITLWVLVSNFAPLWLLYLVLAQTTLVLYAEQVAQDWSQIFIFLLLFVINTIAWIIVAFIKKLNAPNWFLNTVALFSVSCATMGVVLGLWDQYDSAFLTLVIATFIAFALCIWYAFSTKNSFYLSIIALSTIIIIAAALIKTSYQESMLLLVSLFIIVSISLTVVGMINIQKKWTNEK